jgi:DNA mismatch repair protein MutL
MSDIIRLLPDAVANQIAAGEVIQRPASAVKELMENAIDAGATKVQLILRDAGKSLIQVVDDGNGMSDTDARLCFERHATSKIRKSDDLYTLRTMGFRGEALASIAAVAQVELKTRLVNTEIGTKIHIEGSEVKVQEPVVAPEGTSFAIKNLFYNVPARKNFLKSDPVESRHINEEFIRVALANPEIAFTMHQNGHLVYDLKKGNFKQRISAIFGNNYSERMVPIEEETTIVNIEGFVGKPEFSKKSRGEQYFFVNGRFIKDNYLHHAVSAAFESLIPKDAYPSYWLNISIDPASIDVNIHPTKTEIKFLDDKNVYAILRASVKRALGKFSVMPSLDFEQESTFNLPIEKMNSIPVQPTIRVNPNYNPFKTETNDGSATKFRTQWNNAEPARTQEWLKAHEDLKKQNPAAQQQLSNSSNEKSLGDVLEELDDFRFVQVSPKHFTATSENGLLLIDIMGAYERIHYERYLHALEKKPAAAQQQLFPPQIHLSPADAQMVKELEEDLRKLGFDLSDFGNNTIVVNGIPSELESGNEEQFLHHIFEQYRNNKDQIRLSSHENLARAMAKSLLSRVNRKFAARELKQIAIDLLQCENPNYNITGKPILKWLNESDLQSLF